MDECVQILRAASLSPVLIDIGSAGVSHAIWHHIASASTTVGFDPDTRNADMTFGEGYARAILINKAVVPNDTIETVEFVLTEYPSCSSMLEPDMEALASFSFRDYFRPVSKGNAPATSLNRIIQEEKLDAAHWIKLDSQGADLRILQSLSDANLNNLLAVDIEPGLIKAYKNEDLFTDCHPWLIDQGFWMSRLEYQSYPKIRPESMKLLSQKTGIDCKHLMRRLTNAPTAVEGRYLREIRWLRSSGLESNDLLIAAVFGLLDEQYGYAYDVACLNRELFGSNELMLRIMDTAIARIS